ncbi:MAG: hypothetical protein R3245_06180 [Kiloniellales bacterium]|nr:hypothetical protein [Kiloniellales bacterium]
MSVHAQDLGVVVLRGTPAASPQPAASEPAQQPVTVVRGETVFVPSQTQQSEPQGLEAVAGFNGWFIDRSTNRIGNCFRLNTSDVGGYRIKCVWKRL